MAEIKDKTVYKYENLKVRNVGNTSLYEVYFSNGGNIPSNMEGAFTSIAAAEGAISLYISEKSRPKRAYRKRS